MPTRTTATNAPRTPRAISGSRRGPDRIPVERPRGQRVTEAQSGDVLGRGSRNANQLSAPPARSISAPAASPVSDRSVTDGPYDHLLLLGCTFDRVDDSVVANPSRPSASESTEQRRSEGTRFETHSINRVGDCLPY